MKKSQRKALSSIIGTGSIAIQSIATLSMKFEDFPEAMTPQELDHLKRLRSRMHVDTVAMLRLSHKLRKP